MVLACADKDDGVEERRLVVESIRRVLQVAQTTNYGTNGRARSGRTLGDVCCLGELYSFCEANRQMCEVEQNLDNGAQSGNIYRAGPGHPD